jgi:4-amino-4-deoxy-L-arabinose transferase-like glycosyltransferase
VLLAGAVLRLAAADFYEPMVLTMSDSTAYVWAAAGNLYGDATRPAGYSLFLRMGHVVSDDVRFTIGLQHLFGLASALLLYLTTRRLGASRWVATIPAAAVALSGDQIVLEHTLLTEAPFTLLLCAAVYAAVRTLDSPRPYVWAAASGATMGAASTVRTVGLVVVPLLAVWIGLCVSRVWRRRLLAGGAALVAGVLVLVVYAGFQDRSQGTWSLGRTSGWGLYSRVAPFADCSEFTPPDGTRFLCETTPPDQRSGPDFYGWVGGPARERFGGPPNGNEQLNEFARAVVLHQPLAYAEAVTKDTMRYFVPTFGFDRPAGGVGPDLFLFDRRAPGYEEKIEEVVESYYDPFTLHLSPAGVRALTDYQELFRVHGILLLEFLLFGLAGFVVARGRLRQGLVLLLGVTFVLLVLPAATTVYSARYTLPVEGFAAAAAALAGSAFIARLRAPRRQLAD